MDLLRVQNQLLSSHGNASLYAALGAYVELDGYYLESEPCLVCNNPEVAMSTIKLPTIKVRVYYYQVFVDEIRKVKKEKVSISRCYWHFALYFFQRGKKKKLITRYFSCSFRS